MEPSWPENIASHRMEAVHELVKGREFASQLKTILKNPEGVDGSVSSAVLVTKILNSFTNTLAILNGDDLDEVSQFPASYPPSNGRKSEDSGESSKTSTVKDRKDRRGCYKRRKASHSWSEDSNSTPTEDGYAWRKYGQKSILNSQYPRNYYRCTHKYDEGCQATKQVQRIEEEKYRTTYCGHHTCKNHLKAAQVVVDSPDTDSTMFLSFDNTGRNLSADKLDSFLFTSFEPIKQEDNQDDIPSDMTTHHQSSSSSDYLISPDLTTFDHADVISGMDSSFTTMVGCVGFDDELLQFEFAGSMA